MKINIYFFIIANLIILSSCARKNYLDKTVWMNVTPVEKDGVKGNIVNSVYFWDKKTISFYTAIEKDNSIIVKPILVASGNYTYKGNIKKEAMVTANMVNYKNENLLYKGFVNPEGMVLVSPDSIAKGYNISNITIK